MRKDILIPSIGLALGGLAGFLISKVMLEKKYAAHAEERIFKEVMEVKDRLNDKCDKCQFKKVRVDTNLNTSKFDEGVKDAQRAVSSLGPISNQYAQRKRDFNLGGALVRDVDKHEPTDYDDEENEDDNDPDEDLRDGEMMRMEETGNPDPYLISDIEYSETLNHYDKLTCYYYGEDDTMTDEHEQIMFEDDNDKTFGVQNVLDGFNVPNPKTIYIRNERIGADYEIVYVNGSYQELVMGTRGMSPREQQEARARRKEARRRTE